MPDDLPKAADLVETVASHLQTEVRPAFTGLRSREVVLAEWLLRFSGRGQRTVPVQLVALYLAKRVRPALRGWPAFQALIGAHLLMIAKREWQLTDDAKPGDEDLLARIRDHELTDDERVRLMAHLQAAAVQRLRVANPDYLLPEDGARAH